MNRLIKIVYIFILAVISFSFIYGEDEDVKQYIEKKEFKKVEEIYNRDYNENKSEENLIKYADVLAWQKKYNEALEVIKGAGINSDVVMSEEAKIHFWKGDIERADKIYSELEKRGYDTGENGKKVKQAVKERKEFKKYRIKSGLYYSEDKKADIENYYIFEYNYYKKVSTVLTIEDWKENKNMVKQLEVYYGNWYFLAAVSDTWNRAVAAEYLYNIVRVGIKDIDGTKIYKAGIEKDIRNINFLTEANFIKGNERYYKSKIKYDNLIESTTYYDFDKLLNSELKIRVPIYKELFLSGGIKRDFKETENWYNAEIEYWF